MNVYFEKHFEQDLVIFIDIKGWIQKGTELDLKIQIKTIRKRYFTDFLLKVNYLMVNILLLSLIFFKKNDKLMIYYKNAKIS